MAQQSNPDVDSATDLLDSTDADDVGEASETADLEPSVEADAEQAEPRARSKARTRVVGGAGAILLAATTVGAVYFYLQFAEKRDIDDAQAAAGKAACDYVRDLANFSFNNLDPYFDTVLAGATGEWKSQFDARRNDLRDIYTQGEVESQATAAQCAIISGDTATADALVLVTESVSTNATGGNPNTGQLAITLTLDDVDGRWLVSKLSAPQLP